MGAIIPVLRRPSFSQPVLCFTSAARRGLCLWERRLLAFTRCQRLAPSDQIFFFFYQTPFPPCSPQPTFLSIVFRSILIASPLSTLFSAISPPYSPSLSIFYHFCTIASGCKLHLPFLPRPRKKIVVNSPPPLPIIPVS